MEKIPAFIDVDGVFNLIPFSITDDPGWHVEVDEIWHWALKGIEVNVPVGSKERIRTLQEHFELHWATSWHDQANKQFMKFFELGEPLPVLFWDDMKITAILRDLGDKPFVFFDDDLDWELKETGLVLPDHQKTINVDPRTGLTDEHVNEALKLIQP